MSMMKAPASENSSGGRGNTMVRVTQLKATTVAPANP